MNLRAAAFAELEPEMADVLMEIAKEAMARGLTPQQMHQAFKDGLVVEEFTGSLPMPLESIDGN
jgi:hypothetical protein